MDSIVSDIELVQDPNGPCVLYTDYARLAERVKELEGKKNPGPGGCISVRELGNECFADRVCEPNCAVEHLLEKVEKLKAEIRSLHNAIATDID